LSYPSFPKSYLRPPEGSPCFPATRGARLDSPYDHSGDLRRVLLEAATGSETRVRLRDGCGLAVQR
jgi:hypothetical protein